VSEEQQGRRLHRISRGGNDEHSVGHDPSAILNRRSDVFRFQLRNRSRRSSAVLPSAQKLQENGDSNAQPAYSRLPEAIGRIDSDSVQLRMKAV